MFSITEPLDTLNPMMFAGNQIFHKPGEQLALSGLTTLIGPLDCPLSYQRYVVRRIFLYYNACNDNFIMEPGAIGGLN